MVTPPPPRLCLTAALAAALAVPSASRAEDDEASARVAIQRPKYVLGQELRLALGAMPVDPFQKGWTASLSYTVHLDEVFAWEVLQVTGALLASTHLRDSLIDTFATPPEDFAAPRLAVTTGFEVTPLYGKQAFANGGQLHQSLLFGLYGGVLFGDRPSLTQILEDFRPAAGVGLGYRLFLSQTFSSRLDLRHFFAFRRPIRENETFALESVLLFTWSIALNFGGDAP